MTKFNHEFFYGDDLDTKNVGLLLDEVWQRTGLGDQWSREDTILFAGREQVETFEAAVQAGQKAELVLTAVPEIASILEAAGEPTTMRHVVTPA